QPFIRSRATIRPMPPTLRVGGKHESDDHWLDRRAATHKRTVGATAAGASNFTLGFIGGADWRYGKVRTRNANPGIAACEEPQRPRTEGISWNWRFCTLWRGFQERGHAKCPETVAVEPGRNGPGCGDGAQQYPCSRSTRRSVDLCLESHA